MGRGEVFQMRRAAERDRHDAPMGLAGISALYRLVVHNGEKPRRKPWSIDAGGLQRRHGAHNLHLLYSCFWHRFLYDIGVVNTKETLFKRTSQG